MSGVTAFLLEVCKGYLKAKLGQGSPKPSAKPSAKPKPSTKTSESQFVGVPRITYTPQPGKTPDPGEVVWAYVPYEDDPSQGKVRPVLLLGRDGTDFVSVYFSSVDHDLDEDQEAREGRYWVRVGTGSWDKKGRNSYARVDRLLHTESSAIDGRAEVLDKARFDAVVDGIMERV